MAQLINSDIVVAYYDSSDKSFHAVDYTVTAKSQCDGSFGVCPDERVNGRNDASIISGQRHDGITSITYSRPYETNDQLDIPILRNNEVATILAVIGPLNQHNEAEYQEQIVIEENLAINFNSVGENTCTTPLPKQPIGIYPPWPPNVIRGVNNFSVSLGPTGGLRGYQGMTNSSGAGVAWWINGQLIPEIYVERGQTYTFKVEGGENMSNPFNRQSHPFYISGSSKGGFSQKSPEDQRREMIYAGIAYSNMGVPYPTALGRLCEWQHRGKDSWRESSSFKDYRSTVHRMCDPGDPGYLNWTVTRETPNLVYYQSYTHPNIGWRIHVLDPGFNLPQNNAVILNTTHILLLFLMVAYLAR